MTVEYPGSFYEGKPHGPIELVDNVVAIHLDGKPCEFRDVSLRLDEHLDLQLSWTGPLRPGIPRIDLDLKVTFEGGTTAEFLMLSHKYHFVGHEEFSATSRFSPLDLAGKSKGLAEAVILCGPAIHPKKVGRPGCEASNSADLWSANPEQGMVPGQSASSSANMM